MATNSGFSSSARVLPATSSTCLTQSVTATHDFVVTNFSLLDGGIAAGEFVSSSTFSAGGCNWHIRLYPNGNGMYGAASPYVSVYLHLLGGATRIRAKLDFCISGKDFQETAPINNRRRQKKNKGKKKKKKQQQQQQKETENTEEVITSYAVSREAMHTFMPADPAWGWTDFMEKSLLREMLHKDCFTIRCVLTVFRIRVEDETTIQVPPSNLHQDFAQMLKDEEGADVTINVGDQFFLAHKHVLAARSRVFKAQLFGVMRDATQCIRIDDMEPSVFEDLLYFIYTDSLPEENNHKSKNVAMQHLLVAADRYGLGRLSLMCEAKLCSWIDVQSVANILGLADQHQRIQLKDACLRFIALRDVLGAVMETEGFKHLIASCPMIMKEILDTIASVNVE
ncbi:hypothetical protein ACP70R_010352 [Stipagrostis hirtigluma subsp. patula]